MTTPARVHIHPHRGPQDTAYIVGEPAGLLALAETLRKAATGVVGLETVTLYTSDGHAYKVLVSSDVAEDEWQAIKPSYDKSCDPTKLKSIVLYKEIMEATAK